MTCFIEVVILNTADELNFSMLCQYITGVNLISEYIGHLLQRFPYSPCQLPYFTKQHIRSSPFVSGKYNKITTQLTAFKHTNNK